MYMSELYNSLIILAICAALPMLTYGMDYLTRRKTAKLMELPKED